MQNVPTIGKLCNGTEQRDAIHVAVAPVVAAEDLKPGWRIEFCEPRDGESVLQSSIGGFGIVDPFLTGTVKKGQRFWAFLNPGSVTSLRHEWTHPAFSDACVIGPSEIWLRAYAMWLKPYESPEEAYRNLLENLSSGRLHGHGRDLNGRCDVDSEDDLIHHAEIVLGRRIDFDKFSFSCSC